MLLGSQSRSVAALDDLQKTSPDLLALLLELLASACPSNDYGLTTLPSVSRTSIAPRFSFISSPSIF